MKILLIKYTGEVMIRNVGRDVIFVTSGGLISGLLGYLFWFAGSLLYLPNEIGSTTILISTVIVISTISRIGLEATFLTKLSDPSMDKQKLEIMVGSAIVIFFSLGAIISSIMFIIFPGSFGVITKLDSSLLIPIVVAVVSGFVAMDIVSDTLLLTASKSELLPIKQLFVGVVRIAGIFFLAEVIEVENGLIISWIIGLILSTIIVWGLFLKDYVSPKVPAIREVRQFLSLTIGINLSNLMINIYPSVALWIGSYISLQRWGAVAAGEFYILWIIGSFALMLPRTFSRVVTVDAAEKVLEKYQINFRGFLACIISGLAIGVFAAIALPFFSGMFEGHNSAQIFCWGLVSVPGFIVYNFVAKWRISHSSIQLFATPLVCLITFTALMQLEVIGVSDSGIIWTITLSIIATFSWLMDRAIPNRVS